MPTKSLPVKIVVLAFCFTMLSPAVIAGTYNDATLSGNKIYQIRLVAARKSLSAKSKNRIKRRVAPTAITPHQNLVIKKIAATFWKHNDRRRLQKHWVSFLRSETKQGRLTSQNQARLLATAMAQRLRSPALRKLNNNELATIDLQNALQKQQQTLQTMGNISKMLHDTAMAVIRKTGS